MPRKLKKKPPRRVPPKQCERCQSYLAYNHLMIRTPNHYQNTWFFHSITPHTPLADIYVETNPRAAKTILNDITTTIWNKATLNLELRRNNTLPSEIDSDATL